jgi:hypothetical protein
MKIVGEYIADEDIVWLIRQFLFNTPGMGLPLGNLTSQLLVNVYMKVDQFVKHKLKQSTTPLR